MNVFVFFQILKHGALISENEGRVRNRGQISTNQAEGTVSAEGVIPPSEQIFVRQSCTIVVGLRHE